MSVWKPISAAPLALLILAVLFGPAAAQNVGPFLPQAAAEMGVQYRWIHRDLKDDGQPREVDFGETSVIGRYGLTKYATISGEFMIANEDFNSIETDGRYYLVGAGVQGLLWEYERYAVSGNVSVSTTFLLDQTGERCDFTHHGFIVSVQIQSSYRWREIEITPWAGPLYFYYSLEREGGEACGYRQWTSPDRIGAVLGVNTLIYDHVVLYGNLIFRDYVQPRFGLLYRF